MYLGAFYNKNGQHKNARDCYEEFINEQDNKILTPDKYTPILWKIVKDLIDVFIILYFSSSHLFLCLDSLLQISPFYRIIRKYII